MLVYGVFYWMMVTWLYCSYSIYLLLSYRYVTKLLLICFLFLVRSYFISTLASCSVFLRVSVLILSRELFSVVFFFVVFVAVGVYVVNSCDGIYVCSDSTIIMDWIFNRILIFILSTCSVIIVLTVIGLFRRIIVTHYSYCRCFSFPICHRSLVSCCRYFNFFFLNSFLEIIFPWRICVCGWVIVVVDDVLFFVFLFCLYTLATRFLLRDVRWICYDVGMYLTCIRSTLYWNCQTWIDSSSRMI